MAGSRKKAPDVDPVQAREVLLAAISAASEPVALAQLTSMSALGAKLSLPKLKTLLKEDVASGAITYWTAKYLWNQDPKTVAVARLLDFSVKEALSAGELDARVAQPNPVVPVAIIKAARIQLVKDGSLKEVTASGSKKKQLIQKDHPEAHLTGEIAYLLGKFNRHRSSDEILRFLNKGESAERPSDEQQIRETADALFEAMNRIAFSPGTTVTFYRLRQQPELAEIPKPIFDRAALLLQDERKALLSIHDHAPSLSKEEQDRFVTDGLGRFYVSIYAR